MIIPATDRIPTEDRVRRDLTADGPDELWVADVAFVPTAAGFLLLAVALDARSRRIVGRAFDRRSKVRPVPGARDMVIAARRTGGFAHHSGEGSWASGHSRRAAGIRPATGTAGDAFDNALREGRRARMRADRPRPLRD